MIAYGVSTGFYLRDDCINADITVPYLNLEYYRGTYSGEERLLPLAAKAITCEIDYWESIHSYRLIVSEKELAELSDILSYSRTQDIIANIIDGKCTF